MIECVAQLSGIAVARPEGQGPERGFLASIDHAEFSGSPVSGDTLTVTTRVIKSFGRLIMVEGSVASGAGQLLSVQLTLGIGEL
jgi:3-hydroxymyristoyl/3-hydroxydecanoyl-(acyl carrier protein) dehydratase